MSEQEGTTFLQWRERVQNEASGDRPQMRLLMMVAAAVVVAGILIGTIVLMLS
ncbi:hypothetical protein [Saccharopolyspora dendranthemae]|uniref:Uncharacterized protein n=1 Tax=Saccharopolyspora dendranthemae TaxID=1181886 RepID=A0A561VAT7_9PSEU|nr:hypothetical protein [Saccharopolyspora dendranthemae]TWG08736.1 hypothetical protein FHU35_111361 [Saccharopolyspora dendranthemae]